MLRNYFLLLSIKAPRTKELQEIYIRRMVWQKEIIFKEVRKKRKLNFYEAEKFMWENTNNILRCAL
jgi:hypothetical protein